MWEVKVPAKRVLSIGKVNLINQLGNHVHLRVLNSLKVVLKCQPIS
jgi:hypothetical protein